MKMRATNLWKVGGRRFSGRKAGAKTQMRRTSVYLGTYRGRMDGAWQRGNGEEGVPGRASMGARAADGSGRDL